MAKGRINKIVGKISKDITNQYGIDEYADKEIVQSLDLYSHIQKHVHEFESVDSFNHAVFNIDTIIDNPYFVYYEKQRNALLYFKEIDENVCVVVKLTLRRNKDIYVSTLYPISKEKIDKYKDKALLEKYTYKPIE